MSNELSELLTDIKDQILYLQELGVETLGTDLPVLETKSAIARPVESKIERPHMNRPAAAEPARAPSGNSVAGSRLSRMPSLTRRSPAVPNLTVNRPIERKEDPPAMLKEKQDESLFGELGPELPAATETVDDIRAEIGNCTRCPLYTGRTQIVHSTGNLQAELMFVGEAPGADEDAQGFPFVGRAGQLLTKIIEAIGMSRQEVFIGNINRCRPPGNRQPTLEESETCKPYLLREIAVVRPKVVVVMGNTATQNLLNTKVGITKLRGNFREYFGVKVMPTFHPAYLLRDPHKKREVWEDMKKVREYLNSFLA
jgi:uracil-DNA glycosylase